MSFLLSLALFSLVMGLRYTLPPRHPPNPRDLGLEAPDKMEDLKMESVVSSRTRS